ncbi:MAG: hypothetical protein IJS88_04165 [Alphaproteobacteria bacterium]|nr:hypothetical protein [Alphaproteobacteria bacterium]
MEKLSFNDCTIATGNSVISSRQAAKQALSKKGVKGAISLCRVINEAGRDIPCWVCKNADKVVYIMPIMRKENALPSGHRYGIERMTGNELFGYGDTFFRTYITRHGEIGIRAMLIFSEESLVRAACQSKGYNVVTVTPVRVLDAQTRKYLTAAWCVRCMDCSTDFAITFMDLREGLRLDGFNLLDDAVYENIREGQGFTSFGTFYKAQKNDAGEWYLLKSNMQFRRNNNLL